MELEISSVQPGTPVIDAVEQNKNHVPVRKRLTIFSITVKFTIHTGGAVTGNEIWACWADFGQFNQA